MTTTPIRPAVDPLAGLDEHGLAQLAGAALRALPGDSPALLDILDTGLDRLAAQPLAGGVDDEALHDAVRWLQRCESRVVSEKLRRIDAVAQRESFRVDAERSAGDWVAAQTGTSPRAARAQVRVAAALQRLPGTAARCTAGDLTPAHAAAAARGLAVLDRHAHQAELDADDETQRLAAVADAAQAVTELDQLVADRAGAVDADRLDHEIKSWMIQRQPAAEDNLDARALHHRGLRWLPHRDSDGCHTGIIKTTDEGRAHIDAAVAPRAVKSDAADHRSLVQRQHDALLAIARHAAAHGEPATPTAPRGRVLLIDTAARRAGDADAPPAHLDGVGPVGSATADAIACDADTTDVVFDTDRGVWLVGRADGDPSPKQRAVVIARDRACVGCGVPASRCQIHHIRFRSQHGRTIIDNLVLVCWSCHQGLHHLGWTITRTTAGGYAITKRRAG